MFELHSQKHSCEEPTYPTTPPSYTTAPKCVKMSEECDPYGRKCCDEKECVESDKYSYKYSYKYSCEVKATTQPQTTTVR